jgi:phosphate transport system permease protein
VVEAGLFGGDLRVWLKAALGLVYDQRNCVVVGLAMGFAVIPIIFTIAEDSFSSVPQHLTAASLALGASRWQTATRVVLPTASPGIFSAVMIGFGRAVGETMIVIMATGTPPVLDWSIFNGMRTLSANIAVEVPEAPFASSLYRTLFLAALTLFLMTFLVNTIAEVVRQRLRERYRAI